MKYIVCGASSDGNGDIDCGLVVCKTLEDAVKSVYDEMVQNCGGEYQDWMPCSDEIIDRHEHGQPVVVKACDSGSNYDYAWRIVAVEN